ncbi:MAG TPA: hemerythrin domain-containing protein [Methylomirabilota bacterium]|nr:hemerythrin domain-containing protein [Methylomirabilota bacterium]
MVRVHVGHLRRTSIFDEQESPHAQDQEASDGEGRSLPPKGGSSQSARAPRPARRELRAGDHEREELLAEIERELKIHTTIEEQIFYPAFRDATEKAEDRKLYFEAQEEHHVVDTVLPELKSADPASETFAAKAKVLKDLVEHHAQEEETEMFPRARKLLGRGELVRLGEELAQAKVSLTERVLTKLVELVRP